MQKEIFLLFSFSGFLFQKNILKGKEAAKQI